MPHENRFDVIVLKSLFGGISKGRGPSERSSVLLQVYKALKSGGVLLFAENVEASRQH